MGEVLIAEEVVERITMVNILTKETQVVKLAAHSPVAHSQCLRVHDAQTVHATVLQPHIVIVVHIVECHYVVAL